MFNQQFFAAGQVVSEDGTGVADLKVEAWSATAAATAANVALGSATTDANGYFNVPVDTAARANNTVLYFKVYQNNLQIYDTKDEVEWDPTAPEQVIITLYQAAPAGTDGKDRISTSQILSSATFLHLSDFSGAIRDVKDKIGSAKSVLGDAITKGLSNIHLNPIKASASKSSDVVNQDVATATQNLQSKQIAVSEIKEYKPGFNKETFASIASMPAKLEAGQKVTLFQENGQVKYYAITKDQPAPAAAVDPAAAANAAAQEASIRDMQTRLDQAEKNAAAKDQQIATMQTQIVSLQNDNTAFQKVVSSGNDMQTRLAQAEKDAAAKDQQIAAMQTQIASLQNDTTAFQKVVSADNDMQTRLAQAEKDAAAKDQQIAAMQTQIVSLQNDHAAIQKVVSSDNFTRFVATLPKTNPGGATDKPVQ
ncbi:hypothetical protein [Deminuibacter soli]|uniref:Uncharacterized protein n=1 Tax=Deminuibacter soli TaxID=2291815 RepID=A0A3E1NG52_9BACT|nr:hypothetical protein [Deminuibacter soli]RFM26946.1 hypothetical protein DXN05_18350 [Deminuibacter soli]